MDLPARLKHDGSKAERFFSALLYLLKTQKQMKSMYTDHPYYILITHEKPRFKFACCPDTSCKPVDPQFSNTYGDLALRNILTQQTDE
jgi:hypothetical protein